jgi:protein-tyrosine phosphatase
VTFEVLVVCSANVCRSPMAGAVLREVFAGAGLDDQVRVRTYGENATVGAQMCPEMVARAKRRLRTGSLAQHLACQLVPERVEEADLVLTTDRGVRAIVIRSSPAAHPRTFTLRQARELAALCRKEIGGALLALDDPETAMRSFVAEMNQLRGMTDAPHIESRRLRARPWVKVAVHSHDVPDAHQAKGLHSLTADLLISSAQELARHLTAAAHGES